MATSPGSLARPLRSVGTWLPRLPLSRRGLVLTAPLAASAVVAGIVFLAFPGSATRWCTSGRTFHGWPAATWAFWWKPVTGARIVVTKIIFTAQITAGSQPYILSMSARATHLTAAPGVPGREADVHAAAVITREGMIAGSAVSRSQYQP
jgi:hypothetical protein